MRRIAETVDRMDSDENGWCRHDPVAHPDSKTAIQDLFKLVSKRGQR
jgi:hypothetical protein